MSRELYEKIRAMAEKVGYWPNYYAQRMQSSHSDRVGFIAGGESFKLVYGELIDAIATTLRPRQKALTVFYCQNVVEDILPALERMIQQGMDAIIIHASTYQRTADIEQMLQSMRRRYPVLPPIITIFSCFRSLKDFPVRVDEAAIGRGAAERQLAKNCRKFGILCPNTSNPRNEGIIEAYCNTLEEHGVARERIIRVDANYMASAEELSPLAEVDGLWLSFLLAFPGVWDGLRSVCRLDRLHVDSFCSEEAVSMFQWLCPVPAGAEKRLHPFGSLYVALISFQEAGRTAAQFALDVAYGQAVSSVSGQVGFRYVNFDAGLKTCIFSRG